MNSCKCQEELEEEEKDLQGYVVTLQTRFEGAKEASALAISKPNPLVSQFTPSYGMVLKPFAKL